MIAQAPRAERVSGSAHERWVRRIRTSDVAHLEAELGNAAECTPLAMEPLSAGVRSLMGRNVSLFEIDSQIGYQLRRRIPSGRVSIGYANAAAGCSVSPMMRLDSKAIVVCGEGPLDVRLQGSSRTLWIDVDVSAYPHLIAFAARAPEAAVYVPSGDVARNSVGAYVAAMLAMCAADSLLLEDDSLCSDLENELVSRITRSLRWSTAAPAPNARERKMDALATRILAYMWKNVDERVTLAQICRDVGSSTRGAIYCFKDLFGVGPITYLKILRLGAVHRRIMDPNCRLRIIDVAADFGFWHMGHFGSDYRRLFGRPASETVASVRACRHKPAHR